MKSSVSIEGGGTVCTELAESISAYADGEATPDEASRVRDHVSRCASCREDVAAFGSIDRALRVPLPERTGLPVGPRLLASSPPPPTSVVRGSIAPLWIRRAAAFLIVGVGATLLVLLPGPNADAARIARSAATVDVLQEQERRAQENLRRTLEWELRALRLEVALLSRSGSDPVPQPVLTARQKVDQLLARVVSLEESPP